MNEYSVGHGSGWRERDDHVRVFHELLLALAREDIDSSHGEGYHIVVPMLGAVTLNLRQQAGYVDIRRPFLVSKKTKRLLSCRRLKAFYFFFFMGRFEF